MAKDSKTRILTTALGEFAEHGYAGARVGRIATASRTNKQLIYYYFGGKEGLFQRVLDGVYEEVLRAEACVPHDLEHNLLYWMDFHQRHPYLLRLLEWEGMVYARKSKASQEPRRIWKVSLERIERNQGVPGWLSGMNKGQTLIAYMALVTWPIAFPQICRQITGMDSDNPKFIRERRKFMGKFVRSLSAQRSKR
jgi:AcrR family transcriptional regulator